MDVKHYTLPHRGDLVRFIRRSDVFSYDQSSYLIGFKQDGEKDELEMDVDGDTEGEGVRAKVERLEASNHLSNRGLFQCLEACTRPW